ncbi:MAG: tRNA pseudouridine(54/55) synthase Pus10 [Methanosphaera sp. rholeuAM130]|nr:MAG: tRNA pseudouridine(54/55) synthase Pus10 [Methanosphaera sp. rholeuAM130]
MKKERNITDYPICPKCLSRIIKNPNYRDNLAVRVIEDGEECRICENLLYKKDKILGLIKNKINILDVEFNSFIIACQINSNKIKDNESYIHNILNYRGNDSVKQHLKREVGVLVAKKLHKRIDFKNPDVIIMIKIKDGIYKHSPYDDLKNMNIFIDSNPIYIEGKYRKLVRGIPQTHWPCSNCKGKGCKECNYTGQQYEVTVEGLIAKQLLLITRGNHTKFHGSGREDIDVLMLGEGRPFVIEVKHPFKRNIDLKLLRRVINSHSNKMIEVNDLKFTDRSRIAEIKNSSVESYKIYSAIAEFENGVTSNDIEKIRKMTVINQRTPLRVKRRRADLVRTRTIESIDVERINSKKLRLIIKCQGGLYIKELISGDDNRTKPSVSSITHNNAICSQLDVLKVHIPR